MANVRDLRSLAAEELNVPELYWAGLDTLGLCTLGFEVSTPRYITTSRWDNRSLTEEQVEYAAVDAFVSCGVGRTLTSDN